LHTSEGRSDHYFEVAGEVQVRGGSPAGELGAKGFERRFLFLLGKKKGKLETLYKK